MAGLTDSRYATVLGIYLIVCVLFGLVAVACAHMLAKPTKPQRSPCVLYSEDFGGYLPCPLFTAKEREVST